MKYLLDTDHVSILQRKEGKGFAELSGRLASIDRTELALSVVSLHEQSLGCHTYINRARDRAGVVRGYAMFGRVLQVFSAAPVLPFDEAASTIYEGLVSQRLGVATMDLRIASTALAHGLIVLTRNVSDYGRVPGLVTEDWTV